MTATASETTSNAPLPADIPAPPGGQLQRAYVTTVGGKTVTVWQYSVPATAGTVTTPQTIAAHYDQSMTAKGWTKVAAPNGAATAPATGPATETPATGANTPGGSVHVYHHNNTTATVTTRYANGTSGPVMVAIMVGS